MTKTILIADDSKTIQQVVALTFRATDFRVVAANDGDEALRRVSESRPDLVLADVAMPGKNGYELCTQLKGSPSTTNIPVLLLAGSFEPLDERRAQESRADGHIKKPFDSQSLIDRVKSLTGVSAGTEMPLSFAASLAARQRAQEQVPQAAATAGADGGGRASAFAPPRSGAVATEPRHIAADLGVPSSSRQAELRGHDARAGNSSANTWGPDSAQPASPFGPPRQELRGSPLSQDTYAERDRGLKAPPIQAPSPIRAGPAHQVMIDEPEIIDDAEVVEDDEPVSLESAAPSLEPPSPPGERPRANVDMWALADVPDRGAAGRRRQEQVTSEMSADAVPALYAQARANEEADARGASEDDVQSIEEVEVDEIPIETQDRAMHDGVGRIAASAAEPIARAAHAAVPGVPQDQLLKMAREIIERIAWEVVPDLAETIIRAEIDRLLKDKA
jgi:CheY-like chemotaxis protein